MPEGYVVNEPETIVDEQPVVEDEVKPQEEPDEWGF
jgi:hypothetical protein